MKRYEMPAREIIFNPTLHVFKLLYLLRALEVHEDLKRKDEVVAYVSRRLNVSRYLC